MLIVVNWICRSSYTLKLGDVSQVFQLEAGIGRPELQSEVG